MHTQTGGQAQLGWVDALEQEARALLETLDTLPAARRLFDGLVDTHGYAHYLAQTYHYVRWTSPWLARAGQWLERLGHAPMLAELLLQKAGEERGHERWLLADLAHLGWSAERVEAEEPCPAVSAYVAWNHYTTSGSTPAAFLGTAYVLEYLSVHRARSTVERLLSARRIPGIHKAVTFLRGHGDVDGEHVSELARVLRSLDNREERAALALSARVTSELYTGLLREVEARHLARTT